MKEKLDARKLELLMSSLMGHQGNWRIKLNLIPKMFPIQNLASPQGLFELLDTSVYLIEQFFYFFIIIIIIPISYKLACLLINNLLRKGLAMKSQLIDRLLMTFLFSSLLLGLWYLNITFPAHNQILNNVL